MGEAMIAGMIRKRLADPGDLIAAGPSSERLEQLQGQYGIQGALVNAEAAMQADVVVLSVKPQRLDKVLLGLRGSIRPEALVLSIVAGASMKKISSGLHHPIVVRSMPNTPAQIGEGITVWTASPEVSEEQHEMTRQILGALGEQVYVEEETYLDMATALSGTDRLTSSIYEAMVMPGYTWVSRRIAELVAQTVRGSVDYYTRRDDPSPGALRNDHSQERPPRRCIIWRKPAFAPQSRGRFGQRMSAQLS
jgi:pyrroline-5-carboxylate reductase